MLIAFQLDQLELTSLGSDRSGSKATYHSLAARSPGSKPTWPLPYSHPISSHFDLGRGWSS